MALITEIRKNVTDATPLMAVVGVTDYAAERVREVAATVGHLHLPQEVEKARAQLEAVPKQWQARVRAIDVEAVQQAPVLVVHRAMELATRVEESYERLAERGKGVLDRAREAAPTQDLLKQGKVTISRAKAAVTTARKAVNDTAAAARGVFTVGRREVREVAGAVEAEVTESVAVTEKVVTERTQGTRAAVKGAATTVRRRVASTRTATRTAAASARNTAKKAVTAVEAIAVHIGEEPAAPQQPAAPDAAPGATSSDE